MCRWTLGVALLFPLPPGPVSPAQPSTCPAVTCWPTLTEMVCVLVPQFAAVGLRLAVFCGHPLALRWALNAVSCEERSARVSRYGMVTLHALPQSFEGPLRMCM